jgi:hypothetical protein
VVLSLLFAYKIHYGINKCHRMRWRTWQPQIDVMLLYEVAVNGFTFAE